MMKNENNEIAVELLEESEFQEDAIGSRMTANYVAIRNGIGVRGAMSELVTQAAEHDNVSTIFVVDDEQMLVGAIDLKDLIIARATDSLERIISRDFPRLYADALIEDSMEQIRECTEDSLPVLDAKGHLLGVLTAHELALLIEDEIGDDYAKLGGLAEEEDLQEPLHRSIGKRLPWLIVLFGLGLLVSSVVGAFEEVVAHLTLIVSFQSLILGMAGNVGTQSLAVTIRSLMDEGLTGRQKLHLILKEARVGACNGLILGVLSFLVIGGYLYFLKGETAALAFSVSFCTGLALLVSMLLSGISGTVIPILFKKIGIDPAVASGPFITTINDLVAVVTYYGLSWLFLIQVML